MVESRIEQLRKKMSEYNEVLGYFEEAAETGLYRGAPIESPEVQQIMFSQVKRAREGAEKIKPELESLESQERQLYMPKGSYSPGVVTTGKLSGSTSPVNDAYGVAMQLDNEGLNRAHVKKIRESK